MINPGALAHIMRVAERCQRNVVEEIAQDAARLAPRDTGHLALSIHAQGDDRVVAEADYAGYVEMGTSRMHAQPYLRPALYRKRNLRAPADDS